MKDKQIHYLQNEIAYRDQIMEAERHRLESEFQLQEEKILS